MLRSTKFHLSRVRETYFQHFRAALGISARLAVASGACALHALIPGLCTRTGSRIVAKLNARLTSRSDRCEQLRHEHSAFARRGPAHVRIEDL